MKNSDKKLLTDAMKGLIKRLDKTEKFVLDQAPDLCKQMVTEVLIENYIQLAVASIIMLLSVAVIPIAIHNGINYEYSSGSYSGPTRYFFLMVIGFIGALISSGMVVNAGYYLLYLKNCPKLFLLREFKKLVK